MMRSMIAIAAISLMYGCVTADVRQPKQPPAITEDMDTEDAVAAALEFGGVTLEQVKHLLIKRKEIVKVSKDMAKELIDGSGSADEIKLLSAMHLYLTGTDKASTAVFQKLVRSDRELDRVLGWNLAANLPSKEIAREMDAELTRRVSAGDEKALLLPQMASAVKSNQLTSAYTVLRYGLMQNGDDSFAKAMIAIAPARAGEDFMAYLAKASIEELRQLNQTTINVYTCLVILRYYTVNPVPLTSKDFPQLFLYAVSRNQGLSEVASLVIDSIMAQNKDFLALTLSQQPAWVQVAFVEDAKRRKNPNISVFLSELKGYTAHDEVSQEIDEL